MKNFRYVVAAIALVVSGIASAALDDDIAQLQHGWAKVYYQTPEREQDDAIEALEAQAARVDSLNPNRPPAMIWHAIILSTQAKISGGLGALGRIKKARQLLLDSIAIDPKALDGSAYTSLGSLYAKAPGWPIAFGDTGQAKIYLLKALEINPNGIDPNFFYGDLLLDMGDRAGAEPYLRKALAAAPRINRENADAGRKAEAQALLIGK